MIKDYGTFMTKKSFTEQVKNSKLYFKKSAGVNNLYETNYSFLNILSI
jgi:hypothetical protein